MLTLMARKDCQIYIRGDAVKSTTETRRRSHELIYRKAEPTSGKTAGQPEPTATITERRAGLGLRLASERKQ